MTIYNTEKNYSNEIGDEMQKIGTQAIQVLPLILNEAFPVTNFVKFQQPAK